MSCDNTNIYNQSCCPDTPYPSVQHESVPSLIDNLVNALYGEITKTVSGGRVVWNIPCDPAGSTSILGITRNDGEGLMCYLIRALSSTSAVFTGTFVGNLVGNASSATNLLGAANSIPYQSALNTTSFLPFGSTGQVLGLLGSNLAWISAPAATTAAAIIGGTAGSVLWQSGTSATGFTGAGVAGQILTSSGTGVPTWQTNFAGNAASASILQTARSITLAGDVAGTNTFNGSAGITINTTIQPNSVILGTDTTGDYVATIAAGASGAESATSGLTITAPAGETTAAQLALANSGVAAGSYGSSIQTPVITVDARGRVTAASVVNTLPRPGVSFFPTLSEGGNYIYDNAQAFVDTNNQVRTAGSGTEGRLALGFFDGTPSYPSSLGPGYGVASFERIGNEQITKLYVSRLNIYILTSAGNLYSAGVNNVGQLGLGDAVSRGSFTRITAIPAPVADFTVSNGGSENTCHCFAITNAGALYAWGGNQRYQLGDGTQTNRPTPTLITGGAISGKVISKAYAFGCNLGCSFVIDNTGDVYACGYNGYGQMGNGVTGTDVQQFYKIATLKADAVFASAPANVSFGSTTIWILRNGQLWAAGANGSGQCGIGSVTTPISTFTAVSGLSNVTFVSASSSESDVACAVVALLSDGTLRSWGRGIEGALGTGNFSNQTSPQPLNSVSGLTFSKVQMAGNGSTGGTLFALTSQTSPTNPGRMYTCGTATAAFGTGTNDFSNRSTLALVRTPPSVNLVDFCAFGGPGVLLSVGAKSSTNELWTWGRNVDWQCGLGVGARINLPQRPLIP